MAVDLEQDAAHPMKGLKQALPRDLRLVTIRWIAISA